MSEDFDRSFEFFQSKEVEGGVEDNKIKQIWKHDNSWINSASLDTSFEGDNVFEFTADKVNPSSSTNNDDIVDVNNKKNIMLFPSDPFVKEQHQQQQVVEDEKGAIAVQFILSEQVSAMYDDFSQEGAISVTGSIYMKKAIVMIQNNSNNETLCIVLKDVSTNVLRLDLVESICEDISEVAYDNGIYTSDRVLRINLNSNNVVGDEDILIANYSCIPKVRPVPLLIKSRVRASNDFARVGFKIRANPTNISSMKHITIMMAIPPDVDGETVKTSRKGGSWEELKRTLCWSIDELEPGKALEIQAQFALLKAGNGATTNSRIPKFPVLVRCDYPLPFSTIQLSTEYRDEESIPIKIQLSTSSRILHRKV